MWRDEKGFKISYFLPCIQCANIKPGGHTQRYPLSVNPDWQVPPFAQRALSQALFVEKQKTAN